MKTIKAVEKIVSGNESFLKSKFNLEVWVKKISDTYWTHKLHKNPIKTKFIIAIPKSLVKPLKKLL